MDNRRPGCLSGFLQLFLLDKAYKWSQEKFGYKRGGCMGCGCGFIAYGGFCDACHFDHF